RPSGSLAAFHMSDLQRLGLWEVLQRISLNAPAVVAPGIVALLWIAYLCATASVVATAFMLTPQGPQPPQCCDLMNVSQRFTSMLDRQIRRAKRWYMTSPLNALRCLGPQPETSVLA